MREKRGVRCKGDFGKYLSSEIQMMIADLKPVCPIASQEFNQAAMVWIAKNAARFRKNWERYRGGRRKCVFGG
ncbi:MAG: hypothetical protein JW768_15950 [Chitinispirillaceae bacterium]|nr:hypothetical protein [Chitinispirillaceae bacterium]